MVLIKLQLQYVPQKPLSPKELLAALRTLNTLLTIRLTTHEEIPPHMEDWIVKSGRATFRVKDEFELDVSMADEDYASQLYFIDFRFSFSPGPRTLPDGPLRNYVEATINRILSREGLRGCFEFLHEFVLEHKLTILRNQAREMVRSRWVEDAKLCNSNRGIVVQYWLNRPGKKNWIEIAVRSGKRENVGYSSEPPKSFIFIRWHRHGIDVPDHKIQLDPANVSLEQTLNEVIAHHTNWIFKNTKRMLKKHKIYSDDLLSVKHRAHIFNPKECSMKVQLSRDNTVTVTQDGISGYFILSPPSSIHSHYEMRLNNLKDPVADAASQIGLLRCNSTIDRVDTLGRLFGWTYNTTFTANKDTMIRLFGSDKVRYNFYCIPHWREDFLLAITTSMEGDRWWVIEIQPAPVKMTPEDWMMGTYQPLKQAVEIKGMDREQELFAPDYNDFLNVEQIGSLIVSQLMYTRLLQQRIAHSKVASVDKASTNKKVPELYIRFPFPPRQGGPPAAQSDHNWCYPIIKATYISISKARDATITQFTGHLRNPKPHIHSLTGKNNDSLAFDQSNGTFSFRVRTRIGESSISYAEQQMQRLAALIKFLDTADRYALRCSGLSLAEVTFDYSMPLGHGNLLGLEAPPDAVHHTATIKFSPNSPMNISFAKGNPHLAIQDFLNQDLKGPNGLNAVAVTLCATLPILNSLSSLQVEHSTSSKAPTFHVLPRSSTCYNVSYRNKTAILQFEVRLRAQNENVVWFSATYAGLLNHKPLSKSGKSDKGAKDTQKTPAQKDDKQGAPKVRDDAKADDSDKKTPVPLTPEDLKNAWKSLSRERGQGWYGAGIGIVSKPSVVETCIKRIDTVLTEIFNNASDPDPEIPAANNTVPEADKEKAEPQKKEAAKDKITADKSKPSAPSRPQSAISKDKAQSAVGKDKATGKDKVPETKKQAPNAKNTSFTATQASAVKGAFPKSGVQSQHQPSQPVSAPSAQMHTSQHGRPPQNQPSAPQAKMHQSRTAASSQQPGGSAPPANMHHAQPSLQQPQRPPANMQAMQNLQNMSTQGRMQFQSPANMNIHAMQAMQNLQRHPIYGGAPQANMNTGMNMNMNMSRAMPGPGPGAPQANMAGMQARMANAVAQPSMGMNPNGPQKKKTGGTGGPPSGGRGGGNTGGSERDSILIE